MIKSESEAFDIHTLAFRSEVKERSDRLMNYFLISFFVVGLAFAFFYGTWLIAFGVGGLSLIAYYSAKIALPDSDLYQYVLSVVLGIFMAQFIYQMHGLFEQTFNAGDMEALMALDEPDGGPRPAIRSDRRRLRDRTPRRGNAGPVARDASGRRRRRQRR